MKNLCLFIGYLLSSLWAGNSLSAQHSTADFLQSQRSKLDVMQFEEVVPSVDSFLANSTCSEEEQAHLQIFKAEALMGLSIYELQEGKGQYIQSAAQLLNTVMVQIQDEQDSLSALPMACLLAEAALYASVGRPDIIPEDLFHRLRNRITTFETQSLTSAQTDLMLRCKIALSRLLLHKSEFAEIPLLQAKSFIESYYDEVESFYGYDHIFVGTIENFMGFCDVYTANYLKAKEHFLCAKENWLQWYPANHLRIGDIHDNLGQALSHTSDFSSAKAAYEKGLEIRQKNFPPTHIKIAQSHNNLGLLCHSSHDFFGAQEHLKKALAIYEQIPGVPIHEKQIYHQNIAVNLGILGRLEEAMPHHRKAMEIAISQPHNRQLYAFALEGIAHTFRYNLYYDSALRYSNLALDAVGFSPALFTSTEDTLSIETTNALPGMLFAKGEIFFEKYVHGIEMLNYLDSAFLYSMYAWNFLKANQMRLHEVEAKYNLLEQTHLVPYHIALMALGLYQDSNQKAEYLDKLFKAMEINHATLLGDLYLSSLNQPGEPNNTVFAKKLYPFNHLADYKEIQRRLLNGNQKASLVEYVIAQEGLLALVITPDSIYFRVEEYDHMKDQVAAFRQAIIDRDQATLARLGHELYNILLAPFEAYLKNQDHIYIVPDDFLSTLPFEALLTEQVKANSNYAGWPFLIKNQSISYGPSAHFLTLYEEQEMVKSPHMLAICPSERGAAHKGLHLFPKTEEMIKGLESAFRAEVLLGKEATQSRVSKRWSKANVIHLASHVEVNKEDIWSSFLKLYPNRDDGQFQMSEILEQESGPSLICLQGCQSGQGVSLQGEGMVSLAASLGYTGCPSFMASFWEIKEDASAKLYTHFYDYLAEGNNKAASLRKAKLDMISQNQALSSDNISTAEPIFWANTFLTGNTQPISPGSPLKVRTNLLLTGSMVGLFLLLFGIFFQRNFSFLNKK